LSPFLFRGVPSIIFKTPVLKHLIHVAVLVLVMGLMSILAAPLILASSKLSLSQTGLIGDTIGGITAPICSLIGSVLVFLALKGQLVANRITQQQIHDHKQEERIKKEVAYVSGLYNYFLSSFQTFETKYFKGHRAIMKVMGLLAASERKKAHNEDRLYYGTAAELFSILKLGKLFLEQVNYSNIDEHDKHYFKQLVKHHYDSFIIPYLTKLNEKPACEVCGENHNGIPFKMLTVIEETVALF
jgi:hypothetical protein